MARDVKGSVPPPDGRRDRWNAHRETRRTELVRAAVVAVEEHGPDAGLDEIAAAAGVSKPVLYRYFTDKDDIRTAVGRWGAELVMASLLPSVLADGPIRDRVQHGVDAYLAAIEEHPQVFLLLVRHRATVGDDPFTDGRATIAAAMSRVIGDSLRELGLDSGGAEPWAHGLVGLGLGVSEWWLDRRTMSRERVSTYLTELVWNALEGMAADHGHPHETGAAFQLLETPAEEACR